MAKQNKLDTILKTRNPLERQTVTPVDVLETERPNHSDKPTAHPERANRTPEPNEQSETPTEQAERFTRSDEPSIRTVQPNTQTKRQIRTIFDELEEGTPEAAKRQTERYSFEIYTDQKGSIEEVQYLYKKKTGKKLSASRMIREALEVYLTRALETLRQEE